MGKKAANAVNKRNKTLSDYILLRLAKTDAHISQNADKHKVNL